MTFEQVLLEMADVLAVATGAMRDFTNREAAADSSREKVMALFDQIDHVTEKLRSIGGAPDGGKTRGST